MVSKSDKKLLLIAGGVAVAAYFLLPKAKEAAASIVAPIINLPGAIGAGIAAAGAGLGAGAGEVAGGVVQGIGAVGTGIVGGVSGAIWEGFQDITRPDIPLRTHEPVLDVRQVPVPSASRLAYQELIGVPILTPEQYELIQPAEPTQAVFPWQQPIQIQAAMDAVSQATQQVGGQPTSGTYWVNPVTQGAIAPYVPGGAVPAGVLSLRAQDIFPAIRGF